MIDLLLILIACGLLVAAIGLAATCIDHIRNRRAQAEIARSDAWERQMQEIHDDF